jgi:hypothetical protein
MLVDDLEVNCYYEITWICEPMDDEGKFIGKYICKHRNHYEFGDIHKESKYLFYNLTDDEIVHIKKLSKEELMAIML